MNTLPPETLIAHIRELEQQLAETQSTLDAVQKGYTDTVSGAGPSQDRLGTFTGAGEPYRLLVEEMAEGAITLTAEGVILFSNQQFADVLAFPLERVIGTPIQQLLDPGCIAAAEQLLDASRRENARGELRLKKADGAYVPAYVSVNRLQVEGLDGFCMVVTDLTEQKRNEHSVVAEKLARSILEQAAEAILVVDLNGRIIRASRAADTLARGNVLLRQLDDTLQIRSPGGLPLSSQSILAMARRGFSAEPLEMTVQTPDGGLCEVQFSVAPLSGASGSLIGCILHLADITYRKNMERKLRRSEAMYRTLADVMPHVVYIANSEGACEFVNRQWSEYTREPGGEAAMNFGWMSRLHPDDQPYTLELWSQAVQSARPFEAEYRLLRHDNEYRWHLTRATPILDEIGSVINWIGTATDIHEYKRTESLLRESEARLRTTAEAVPEILFTTLADGTCEYVSARASEFTGLPSAQIEGSGWIDALHPEDRERVRQCWSRCIADGSTYFTEYRLRRHDGAYRWMQARAVPMRGPNGETLKWCGICSDIDDLKRLEETLQQRSRELARSNDELQRFAYAASHDLQEPLRTIAGMSRILAGRLRGLIDAKDEELLSHIDGSVNRMSSLIRDLLDYSLVALDGQANSEPVNCQALLEFALMNVRSQVEATGATITWDPLPSVMAGDQLVRVFQNLIGNSLKYRGEQPPHVHIGAAVRNGEAVISVKDNGMGLDMRYAERIFGVFQRLHGRGEYEGTGIGLAICKKVIEQYGGRIWVESVPGVGTTFSFSLPAAH